MYEKTERLNLQVNVDNTKVVAFDRSGEWEKKGFKINGKVVE